MNLRIRVHSKGVYLHSCEKTNIMLLKLGMSYIGLLIESRRGEMEQKNAKKFEKRTTYVRNVLENLANISAFPFPYSSSSIKEMNRLFECADFWSMPSLYNLYKLSELMKEFYKYYPQAEVDGTENIWVMKPSFSSRGIGVHCINSTKEAFSSGKKMQAKVLQKYIERPLLLQIPGPAGKLEARKFDIRQWVLVTSFSPLEIYMFNSCYLRICGSEFKLENFKDNFRHISNFSIQKNNARVGDFRSELIMSASQFTEHLKKHCGISMNWERDMLPRFAKVVKETIFSAWDVVTHHNTCFELFGFDFLLDEALRPWLIEVNLSPACCERTDWLVEMLDKMADGLINVIKPRLPGPESEIDTTPYKWIKIYDMRDEIGRSPPLPIIQPSEFELWGKKINLRYERKIDKKFNYLTAVPIINRNVRMWLAKLRCRHLRQLKLS